MAAQTAPDANVPGVNSVAKCHHITLNPLIISAMTISFSFFNILVDAANDMSILSHSVTPLAF